MTAATGLRWIESDRAGLARHGGAIEAILRRELDGVTVLDAFDGADIGEAVRSLEMVPEAMSPVLFGRIVGRPLAEHRGQGLGDTIDDYLAQADRCRRHYRDAFGYDPHERAAECLRPLAAGRHLRPPVLNGRAYNPGSVRWYEGGGGGLPAHVENEFEMHGDASTSHLREEVDIHDHFSFFVVMQRPTEGGALTLYDAVDGEDAPEVGPWVADGRDDSPLDQSVLASLDPPEGSLVVFGGGWRWHRVDPVTGPRPRVTYGGFGAPFRQGDDIATWF